MSPAIEEIFLKVKSRAATPKKMELATFGGYYFVNSFDAISSKVISESVSCGFDKDPNIALAKCLSEFFEGKAFSEGYLNGIASCQTARSDGFAAYPIQVGCKEKAQANAKNEAVERYVWASWWDLEKIGHDVCELTSADLTHLQVQFVSEMKEKYAIQKILIVSPHFEAIGSERLIILVGFLKDGGVVSGGACGTDQTAILDRALPELFRHALAVKRMRQDKVQPDTFYEKRLHYFATAKGQALVEARLQMQGDKKVVLPKINFDEEVPHTFSDLFYVHRVLFEGQPEFIGGKLERFCI